MEVKDKQDDFPTIKTLSEAQCPPIVDEVDADTTYVGYAPLGTKESAAEWKIMRVLKVGTVTKSEFPDSSMDYKYVWDDRVSLTYSR